MPRGAGGDAGPSQRRMAAMSRSSPSEATDAEACFAYGCISKTRAVRGCHKIGKASKTFLMWNSGNLETESSFVLFLIS
jgi:hypothetical protein